MPDHRESEAADYLAGLPEAERREAVARINAQVKLKAPVDSVDPPPPVRNLGEYLETDFPVPPFLVSHGQLCRGEITAMVARAGKGKTTLAQNRIVRWSAGLPLFDEEPDNQAPVQPLRMLLIPNEGAAWHMQNKLGLLLNTTAGLDDEARELANQNAMVWGDGGYSGLKIDREADREALRRACDEHQPDVLVLEPFRKLWSGEENSSTEMEAVLDDLVAIASDAQCAVMLAHHARKSAAEDGDFMTEARGSVVLEDTAAVMEHFKPVKGNSLRELSWSKSRYAPPSGPVRMSWDPETWRLSLVPEDEASAAIMKLLKDSPSSLFTVGELAEELDESAGRIRTSLEHLLDTDRIVKKKATGRDQRGYVYRLMTGDDDHDETGGLEIS